MNEMVLSTSKVEGTNGTADLARSWSRVTIRIPVKGSVCTPPRREGDAMTGMRQEASHHSSTEKQVAP